MVLMMRYNLLNFSPSFVKLSEELSKVDLGMLPKEESKNKWLLEVQ